MFFPTFRSLILFLTVQCIVALDSIRLCGCETSACPTHCDTFELGKCAPLYQCFLEGNPLLIYVKPVVKAGTTSNVTLVTYLSTDSSCQNEIYLEGWEGDCDDSCWSEDVTKIGARGCSESSATQNEIASSSALFVVMLVGMVSALVVWTRWAVNVFYFRYSTNVDDILEYCMNWLSNVNYKWSFR